MRRDATVMGPTTPGVAVPDSTLHELACRVLCGASVAWPFSSAVDVQSRFLVYTYRHGVQPLVYAQLRSSDTWDGWPLHLRQAMSQEAASQAVLDAIQEHETIKVLEALSQNDVKALLLKGMPLAYTHYQRPHHRPRGDTDMLIRRADREMASSVLAESGYKRRNTTSGELVSYQDSWRKIGRYDVTHIIDLHWRVNNCQMFAGAVSHDEFASGSVPIPRLGARALGPVHALLLACMHRVAHITAPWSVGDILHYGDRLIWLYDIHLLTSRMLPQELTEFARLAVERRLKTICLDGLRQSQKCFTTPLPDDVLGMLSAAGPSEQSAHYLAPGRLRYVVRDIQSLSNVRDRLRLTKEHLFPPAEYMLKKYAVCRRAWLPMLYLRRGAQGILRLIGGNGNERTKARPRASASWSRFRRGMRLSRQFIRLSPDERRVLLVGGLVVACVRILLWLLPFKRLVWLVECTALRFARIASVRQTEDRNASIAWGVTTAARYVPRATCLTQALAAQWLFARRGRSTLLRIGVAKRDDNTLMAHAWLENEGRVVVGGESLERNEYAVFPLPGQEPALQRMRKQ